MARNQGYGLVHRHVGREYLLAFGAAFVFFFFIFFVNQILLLAQKILVKNVELSSVIRLIGLSIPQFLIYTFPFSALTASSMVIGDLSGSNEILAIRSSGISIRHVWIPIIAISFLLGCLTLFTADVALPWSTRQYKALYSELMQTLPTLELQANAANTIGDKILVTGNTAGNNVDGLVLLDIPGKDENQVLSAAHGTIEAMDMSRFVYRLDLENPVILDSNAQEQDRWGLSQAASATLYLDFSGQVSALASATPAQLSLGQLREKVGKYVQLYGKDLDTYLVHLRKEEARMARRMADLDRGILPENPVSTFNESFGELTELRKDYPINFYYQYYRAELNKKYALSAACFMLVFLTFSLSFFKVRHGRLIGFGLSMLVAVLYWYLLFFAQLKIFSSAINPAFLVWTPDLFFFLAGILLLGKARRA
jgi:lipopolysaccharide export system permease protein